MLDDGECIFFFFKFSTFFSSFLHTPPGYCLTAFFSLELAVMK